MPLILTVVIPVLANDFRGLKWVAKNDTNAWRIAV